VASKEIEPDAELDPISSRFEPGISCPTDFFDADRRGVSRDAVGAA